MTRLRLQMLSVLCAATLVVGLGFGALSHSLIPHDHAGNAIEWQSLHASLSHDQKKALGDDIVIFLLAILAIQTLVATIKLSPAYISQSNALRRGILPYRRFD